MIDVTMWSLGFISGFWVFALVAIFLLLSGLMAGNDKWGWALIPVGIVAAIMYTAAPENLVAELTLAGVAAWVGIYLGVGLAISLVYWAAIHVKARMYTEKHWPEIKRLYAETFNTNSTMTTVDIGKWRKLDEFITQKREDIYNHIIRYTPVSNHTHIHNAYIRSSENGIMSISSNEVNDAVWYGKRLTIDSSSHTDRSIGYIGFWPLIIIIDILSIIVNNRIARHIWIQTQRIYNAIQRISEPKFK
jgi:hypothetical protein